MDLKQIKTKSGKSVTDFKIPEKFLSSEPELISLVLRSESMNDDERQYWFNLLPIMTPEQIEKLRDILTRERAKLDEIEAKYAPKKQLSPEEKAAQLKTAQQKAEMRAKKMAQLKERERAEKDFDEDAILAELED